MALEHAILVSLGERAAAGSELTHRFDRSFGFFWTATHQQIYRVLGRMERDGWIVSEVVPQADRPAKKVYAVTDAGRAELRRWIAEPTAIDPVRSDLGVKLRGASFGDREALLDDVRRQLDEHTERHSLYQLIAARDFPDGIPGSRDGRRATSSTTGEDGATSSTTGEDGPTSSTTGEDGATSSTTGDDGATSSTTGEEARLDMYLVLRGGLFMEEFWIRWLTEYLDAHDRPTSGEPGPDKETR